MGHVALGWQGLGASSSLLSSHRCGCKASSGIFIHWEVLCQTQGV